MAWGDMRFPHQPAKVLPPASSLYDCTLYGMAIAYPLTRANCPSVLLIVEPTKRNQCYV